MAIYTDFLKPSAQGNVQFNKARNLPISCAFFASE